MITAVLVFFLFLILLTFAYAGWRGAPWVPTWRRDVDRFLALAQIQPGQKVYDLGCGDGRIVCAAAKAGADACGYEVSLFPFILATLRRLLQKERSNIRIIYRDLWNADLRDADCVYFFLMPKVYPELQEKLRRELKTGAKVIAYVWPIKAWTPLAVNKFEGYPNLYLYEIAK